MQVLQSFEDQHSILRVDIKGRPYLLEFNKEQLNHSTQTTCTSVKVSIREPADRCVATILTADVNILPLCDKPSSSFKHSVSAS